MEWPTKKMGRFFCFAPVNAYTYVVNVSPSLPKELCDDLQGRSADLQRK
jgi:hypothetical protein